MVEGRLSLIHLLEDRVFEQIFSQVVVDFVGALLLVVIRLTAVGVTLHVRVDDEGGQLVVDLLLNLVTDDSENIETRENGVGQINVVVEIH